MLGHPQGLVSLAKARPVNALVGASFEVQFQMVGDKNPLQMT
jgi:hypothetical protein